MKCRFLFVALVFSFLVGCCPFLSGRVFGADAPKLEAGPEVVLPAPAQSWSAVGKTVLTDLSQPPVLLALAAALVQLLKVLSDAKKLDCERWQGLVQHLYNMAEASGLPGADKLKIAADAFTGEYVKTFGVAPKSSDLQDLKLDLALAAAAGTGAPSALPSTAPAAAPAAAAPAK